MDQGQGRRDGRIAGAKTDTKSKDEVERAKISGDINRIFDQPRPKPRPSSPGSTALVTTEFDKGEAQARGEFTAKHKADMEKYKDKRYSGPAGWVRWAEDLFTGLPAEANKIYDDAKALYESKMTVVISTVADLIGRELDKAKARIAKGRQEIKAYIDSRPANLQKIAAEAGKEMSGKFDQLESDVDSKQQSLVDDLANKYVEARGKVDEEIKAEQDSNKGFIDKAKDAVWAPSTPSSSSRRCSWACWPRPPRHSPRSWMTRSSSSRTSCRRSSRAS